MCDADQALTFGDFKRIMAELASVPQFAGIHAT
jgi:hypothetical protein